MRIYLKNNGYALSAKFPMTVFEMEDALDKLKQKESVVRFEISEYDNMELPTSICGREFSANIYRLNLVRARTGLFCGIIFLKNILNSAHFYPVEPYKKVNIRLKNEFVLSGHRPAFKSLLAYNPECDFEDMLLMTYGLDSVMVYPCQNCYELGETVIENEMVPELESCSDEILGLLDREKIGSIFRVRDDGQFIDGCYCVTSSYEKPDINIEIGRPEKCFFRLLIAPYFAKTDQSQWLTLPCEKERLSEIYDHVCLKFQSSLPMITNKNFESMKLVDELNFLAQELSKLSNDDFVKLKAMMEVKEKHEIYEAYDCLRNINEYEFDQSVQDYNEFGITYLSRNLPTNFDVSALEDMNLYDFSMKILAQTGGEVTSYGALSGRDQGLYSALTTEPEQ